MRSLQVKWIDSTLVYDGTQLSPHWIYNNYDLLGDGMVGFIGPADVKLEHMVDWEDVKRKSPIFSPLMLHFVGEWFIDDLYTGILLQHLLVANVFEALLQKRIGNLLRRGNDLYYKEGKLSVSIATRSLVSVLIHMGINIRTENVPVKAAGLKEMGVEPIEFGQEILCKFSEDHEIFHKAKYKVRPR